MLLTKITELDAQQYHKELVQWMVDGQVGADEVNVVYRARMGLCKGSEAAQTQLQQEQEVFARVKLQKSKTAVRMSNARKVRRSFILAIHR